MKSLLLLLTSTICLVACLPVYKSPATGPTALLLVRMPDGVGDFVRIYSNDRCDNPHVAMADSEGTITVPAGERLFIGKEKTVAGVMTFYCISSVSFVPEPSAMYEVGFLVDFTAGRCALPVLRVFPSGQKQREQSLRYLHHKDCGFKIF